MAAFYLCGHVLRREACFQRVLVDSTHELVGLDDTAGGQPRAALRSVDRQAR
jgi:hypothetical protein